MSFSSLAECRTYQFSYPEEKALYRDHKGRRVLADVEGKGVFCARHVPKECAVYLDDHQVEPGVTDFSESLLIASSSPGLSQIAVACGSFDFQGPDLVEVDHFTGCGVLLSSKKLAAVDDGTDGWAEMPQPLPIPIFLEAKGRDMRIAPLPFTTLTLRAIKIDEDTDLKNSGWTVQNSSRLFALTSDLPSYGRISRNAISHLNRSAFSFEKPEGCRGVILRKLYDVFHGRQRARVLVNGKFRGWWYEPVEDRASRWRWGRFGFACEAPEQRLTVEIDPPAGSPLWSVAEYQILGLVPTGG